MLCHWQYVFLILRRKLRPVLLILLTTFLSVPQILHLAQILGI